MNVMDWITFSIVIACLLVSAFFSASETALTGASRASMLRLSKQGNREAGVVSSLFAMRERMIGALLLGNNIANIGASALATGIFTAWFGEVGVLYATGVMTVLVVIFAEVLPKTIAINAPDRVSLLVARPMKLMVYLLGPLLTMIEAIVAVLMKVLGIKIGANQPILSPTERLRGAVDLLHHEGKVEKQDRDMFGGLLDLRELQVSDVMVHRTEMVMINADLPPEELVREVLATEYTRIPLWRDKPENIIGVLHAKDLLRAIRAVRGRHRQHRRLDHRAAAVVRAGNAPGLRTAQGVPPPQDPFRAGRRRIRRSRGHGDAGGHSGRNRRRYLRRARRGGGRRPRPARRLGGGRRLGADPRSQPRDGLASARRRGDHGRGPRDPRGALDPRARPELYLPRLPLPRAAPRAQPHHRAADRRRCRGRPRSRRRSRSGRARRSDVSSAAPGRGPSLRARFGRKDSAASPGACALIASACTEPCEFRRQRRIDHAVAFDPALPFERRRHNINPEMRLAARPVAGMALMQM